MRTETSANYETRLKDLPEIAVAWERRDYEHNLKDRLLYLLDDDSRARARLSYELGMTRGLTEEALSYCRELEGQLARLRWHIAPQVLPELIAALNQEYAYADEDDVRRYLEDHGYLALKDDETTTGVSR